MKALKNKKSILENIIISTCNRTEIYAVGDQLHTSRYYIKEFLSEWFNIDKEEFSKYLFIYEGDGAVEHLFSVTCGLNSMILGETQILGQVRSSYLLGQKEDTIGTVFNHLFKQALTLAKKLIRKPKSIPMPFPSAMRQSSLQKNLWRPEWQECLDSWGR